MDTFEKLKEAKQLFDQGIINEEEYQKLKDKFLNAIDNENKEPAVKADSNENTVTFPAATTTGAVSSGTVPAGVATKGEGASFGMKALSFLIPLVGLILFIVDKDKKPEVAKDEILWAAIGFGIGLVFYFIAIASTASYY